MSQFRSWFKPQLTSNFKQITFAILALLILYLVLSLVRFLFPSPFQVALLHAQAIGGWQADQIEFRSGSYHAPPFGSSVEAEMRVVEANQNFLVFIKLAHSPFGGWSVEDFHTQKELPPDTSGQLG